MSATHQPKMATQQERNNMAILAQESMQKERNAKGALERNAKGAQRAATSNLKSRKPQKKKKKKPQPGRTQKKHSPLMRSRRPPRRLLEHSSSGTRRQSYYPSSRATKCLNKEEEAKSGNGRAYSPNEKDNADFADKRGIQKEKVDQTHLKKMNPDGNLAQS